MILGRGANFILPHDAGLRVHIVAPWKMRVHRFKDEQGYDENEALQNVTDYDKE